MNTTHKRKNYLIGLLMILMILTILLGIPQSEASAESYDFNIYLKCADSFQIPLDEFSSHIDEYNTIPVDMYISSFDTAKDVSTLSGTIYYDKTIFSLLDDNIVPHESTIGRKDYPDWATTFVPITDEAYPNRDQLGFYVDANGSDSLEVDTAGRLIATLYFEVLQTPTENTQISFDFSDVHDPGQSVLSLMNSDGSFYNYFDETSDDWSNLKCDEKLYIGDVIGGDPSSELTELSLKSNDNSTEYISGTFDPATTTYTTSAITYQDSINGVKLNYSLLSGTADSTVTFNDGSSASIDENNLITGLNDNDVININVTDDDGAVSGTYSITTTVTPASTNANLSILSAATSGTAVSFEEPFSADTLTYTLNIPYNKNEVSLTCATSDSNATLYIDSVNTTSKTFTNLSVGTTTKVIKVRAEDNATVKNYNINIVRAAPSSNVDLNSITVNGNYVEIGEDITSFISILDESITSYVFTIKGAEPTVQTVQYQYDSIGGDYTTMPYGTNNGSPKAIAKGESVLVNIKVIAEDPTVTKDYSLSIQRAPSTNTELEQVTITEDSNTKTLNPTGTTYEYTIGTSGASSITALAVTKAGENASYKILDPLNNEVENGIIDISSIDAGTYAYQIEVSPQDVNGTKQIYTLNIIKKSSAKELFMPKVTHTNNSGTEIEGITYDETTFTYTLTIDYELNDIVVNDIRTVFTASANSTITNASWTELKSGTPLGGLTLSYADTNFNNTTSIQYLNRDIFVTAEDGSIQQYQIHFTRLAADTDNTLSTLSVAGTAVEGFDSGTLIYSTPIVLPGDTTSVNVEGEATSNYATISYNGADNGQIELSRGVLTTININVKAQSGDVRTYIIKVIAANNDNDITNIELLNNDSEPIGFSFNPADTGPYSVTVPYTVSNVTINVTTPNNACSVVTGAGMESLNINSNTFKVYATSEAGIKGSEYTIVITRNPARTENILDSITISSSGTNPVPNYISTFNSSTTSYDIRVNRDVTSLKVQATVPIDNGSSITSGLTNNFTWAGTSAVIYIVVKAENASEQTYTINVTRANDINDINDIYVYVQEISYIDTTTEYALNPVSYSTDKITYNVDLADSYSQLYVKVNSGGYTYQESPDSFDISLITGQNTIKMYAKSDYGTQGTVYEFTITREVASSNANLSNLEIIADSNNILTNFVSSTKFYEIRVDHEIASITINATVENTNANYTISPAKRTLAPGENDFYITVTAEDGTTKSDYYVKITRANDINTISDIQVTDQTFDFDADTTAYTLQNVNYNTTSIRFNVTLDDKLYSKLYSTTNSSTAIEQSTPTNFDLDLDVGTNTIKLYANSEFGTQGKIYAFTITRNSPNANCKLSALEVIANGSNILDNFDTDTTLYNLRVDNDITSIAINATTTDSNATTEITPASFNLINGLNTYYVKVTAEDGITKLEYRLNVTRANDVNTINNITVDLEDINYNATTYLYELEPVKFNVATAKFNVSLLDSTAKVYVIVNSGSEKLETTPTDIYVNLVEGDNTIKIYAVSEFGTKGEEYTFTVTKNAASSNAKLSALEVIANGSNILDNFKTDTTLYNLRVDNDITSIAINATTTDNNATTEITPASFNLVNGINTYYVKVTAEDGTTKLEYRLNVTRANDVNTINNITVDLEDINYSATTYSYELEPVKFNVATVKFNVSLLDSTAKVYVIVNSGSEKLETTPTDIYVNLVEGDNTIKIYAVSEFGTKGKEYTFTVTKNAASSNAKLSALEVIANGSNILDNFDTDTTLYNLRVDNDVDMVTINSTTCDNNASVSFVPEDFTLSSGLNTFSVIVTAEDGTTKITYKVKITKANDNNTINNIKVDPTEITYDESQTEYNLDTITYSIDTINFNVETDDPTAKLYYKLNSQSPKTPSSNNFNLDLDIGENTIIIYAVSEFGTEGNHYEFNITRKEANTDVTLKSLSVKALDTELLVDENEFRSNLTEYNLRVDNNITTVDIVPVANYSYSTVSITPNNGGALKKGKINTFYVTVTAESGAYRNYILNIARANDNNTISEIKVNGASIELNPDAIIHLPAVAYTENNISITATLEDSSTTIYGTGVKTLVDGTQIFEIYAISEYGLLQGQTKDNVPVYAIEITRTPVNTDNKLDDLFVTNTDANPIAFDNNISFAPNCYTYTITLEADSTLSQIIINAVANTNNKTLSGDTGIQNLIVNENGTIASHFVITVTAENGTTQSYSVNVVKGTSLSDDNSISSVSLRDANNNEYMTFNESVDKQSDINIPYDISNLTLTVTPNDENATVTGNVGNISLTAGNTSYIQFKVIAEDGSESLHYNFNITRAAPKTENYLETLTITDKNDDSIDFMEDKFDSSVTEYDIRVDDVVENIVLTATVPSDNGSTILSTIKPFYALTSGAVTTISIIVKAENNDTNIYTINIKRANNDNEIESIKIGDKIVAVSEFTLLNGNYEYNAEKVINSISSINIEVTLKNGEQSKATVTGAGLHNLNVGTNNLTVYATAQDGTKGDNYIIRLERDTISSDATLKSLNITANSETLLDVPSDVENSYELNLDRTVTEIEVTATKNFEGASISGDIGTVNLVGGKVNELKIYVSAEDGTIKVYTINVDVKDTNNKITNISTTISELNFDETQLTYNLGTVEYSKENIDFSVTLGSTYSKLYLNSSLQTDIDTINQELVVGENIFEFYAKSENEIDGQIYTIKIERNAADTNNYLSSITVNDNNNVSLSFTEGAFNREIQAYTVILDENSTATYVDIQATAEKGTVTGTGIHQLVEIAGVISNTFTLSVTAENGDVREYKITVIKQQTTTVSDDTKIKDISLIGKGNEYLKDNFDSSVSLQSPITVPFDVDSVYLSITADSKATVTGTGLYNIAEGETITLNFQVTAENGDKGLNYYVDVTREIADDDNSFEELYYIIDGTRTDLETTDDVLTINIEQDVESIELAGTVADTATVTGLGEFDISSNLTSKVVSVTAQNGDTKTYVINIIKQSDDASMKSILLNNTEILDSFVNNEFTQIVNYSTSTASIIATPTNSSANVVGNGTFDLVEGQNQFIVYATSQAGTKGIEYTIKITRQPADTDNNLASLIVKDTAAEDESESLLLQPIFDNEILAYTIDLTDYPEINEISINAIAESSKALKVEGTGTYTLKTGFGESSEIFKITVTAENNTTKTYQVTVIRNVKPEDDITVNEVSFIGSNSVNYLGTDETALTKFEMGIKNYTVTIPHKVTNATLTVTNSNGATIYGNGNYLLNTDEIIDFQIISQSGKYTSDTYYINVIKELPSEDNTLKSLSINDELIEGFDPEITEYSLTVSYEKVDSIKIGAEANDAEATLIGDLGEIPLISGINNINITVTAENGEPKTYSISVSRLSEDNELLDLQVVDYTLNPVFDKETKNYSLTVSYDIAMVNVMAQANIKATIVGDGLQNLELGSNTIDVYVVSEQGIKGDVYTIEIEREIPSDDNTLKSLTVLSGTDNTPLTLSPIFKPETTDYVIQLEDTDINTLNILAEANCPFAKGVGGTGYKVLKTTVDGKYHNVFEIIVMAQNDETKTYTVSVYRDVVLADDISIGEVKLMGSDGVNYLGNTEDAIINFMANIYTYNVTVPYFVESVTLTIDTLTATAYGTGQKMFDETNIISYTAYLVSQSCTEVSNNYKITVNREIALDDNTLKNIKINGESIEDFSPSINNYEISVPFNSTNKVIISAVPNSPSADILSGVGTFDIELGRNVFSILVRSQNGDTRCYNVIINNMNNNAYLDSLTISGSTDKIITEDNAIPYPFEFDPDVHDYIVNVGTRVQIIDIEGQAQDQDKAAIIGLGEYKLEEDTTDIVIHVVAADNVTTKTYNIKVVRKILPSTKLKDLQVTGCSIPFDPNNMSYSLEVDEETSILDIKAIAEDPNANVSIIGNDELKEGNNVIMVQVKAEDGTVSYYQLSVNKKSAMDYFLTFILILIFILLLILMLYRLFILNNKNKEKKKKYKDFKLHKDEDPIDLNNISEETKKWEA